ncbi:hypothetical protein ABIA32_001540 [Streptacidiphilus sp. MAP12-20]|uniref:hypothetical protein n=1 Tax=Streptacidiphilus sp. MAP12-20 TaxID=3156299 RepID=UPI0035182D36
MSAAGQPFAESEQGPLGRALAMRYRAPTWQATFGLGCYALMAALLVTDAVTWPIPGEPLSERLTVMWPFALLALQNWWLSFWVGIVLTPEAAVIYRFRRRTVPWSKIAEVAAEPFALGTGRRAVLYLHDGTRIPLRQPCTGFLAWDRRFDEKLGTIHAHWLAGGGVPWSEDEEDEPLADSFRLSPSVLQRIYPSFPMALVAIEVVVGSSHDRGSSTAEHLLGWLVGLLILGCASRFWFVRTIADREQLVSRDLFGRRTALPWAEVRALQLVSVRRTHRIAMVDATGRTLLLAAPRGGALLWDSEFSAKAQMLCRRWSELFPEAAAAPLLPPALPQPAAPYTGPRLWQRAVVGIIGIAYGYGGMMAVLVGLVVLLMQL